MKPQAPAVRLDDVAVRYTVGGETVDALRGVTLTCERGRSMAVVGRSGSGKSTLVAVLALLRRPTSGDIVIEGEATSGLKDTELSALRSRFVGTVFQSFHLEPAFTAEENAMLPWYFQGDMSRRAARTRSKHLLGLLGIGDLARRRPSEMSGGQRQRVAIARALFTDPALLIADEPTGNLDEATAGDIADVLFGLAGHTGAAVVVVTHDAQIADRADRRVSISAGRLEGST